MNLEGVKDFSKVAALLVQEEEKEEMLKKIRHIGIVVNNFEQRIEKFTGFGFSCSEVTENKEVGVRAAFFPIGDTLIEFLSYTGPDKGHDNVVRQQKDAINHLCFEVDNLEGSIRDFRKMELNWSRVFLGPGPTGTWPFSILRPQKAFS